jgi:hypothetical protein
MPGQESLDEIIGREAAVFADQVCQAAKMADTEQDIRIEFEKQLAFVQRTAGITLEGRHEVTVASGRIDSVYDRVVIEYKNPASPGDRIGPADLLIPRKRAIVDICASETRFQMLSSSA